MKLEVEKVLPIMLKDLSPRDRAEMAAQVVKTLQKTGEILQKAGASEEIMASFREDAAAANAIARLTVADEGFNPDYAFQVKLPLIETP